MNRRALLVATGGVTAALAGCSTFDGRTDDPADHRVRVENLDDETHEVSLTLVSDGETLVESTRTVAPGADWDVGTYEAAGEYELTVSALGGERNRSYTLPLAEGDRASFAVARLTDDGALDVEVYWEQ